MAEKKKASSSGGSRKKGSKADPVATIIEATMTLAAERLWREITLADIADAAGLTLAELRAHVSCKGDILRALADRADAELLKSVEKDPLDGEARDRLFEAIMRRLEFLAPWRAAIRNIMSEPAAASCECPSVIERYFISQRWILAATGLEAPGMEGAARTFGLGMIYARTLRTWVEDDDPGLSRTMARLDRDLDRACRMERRLAPAASAARAACGLLRAMARAGKAVLRPATRTHEMPAEENTA